MKGMIAGVDVPLRRSWPTIPLSSCSQVAWRMVLFLVLPLPVLLNRGKLELAP